MYPYTKFLGYLPSTKPKNCRLSKTIYFSINVKNCGSCLKLDLQSISINSSNLPGEFAAVQTSPAAEKFPFSPATRKLTLKLNILYSFLIDCFPVYMGNWCHLHFTCKSDKQFAHLEFDL